MALPVITVLVCALFLELFSLLGYNLIGEKAYRLFRTILPSPFSKRLGSLRQECMQVKKEMDSTSAMDEFAKWAKLRRRFDKLVAELDSSTKIEASDRASFERSISWGLRAFMWIFQTYLILSFSTEPMFYVPRSWTGPFGYMLSLPFAPHGSVSVVFWLFACKNAFARGLSLFK